VVKIEKGEGGEQADERARRNKSGAAVRAMIIPHPPFLCLQRYAPAAS